MDITATNKGDEAFTFELAGTEHRSRRAGPRPFTSPSARTQAYDFTVTAAGFSNFSGRPGLQDHQQRDR